jgi:hypothetical protein
MKTTELVRAFGDDVNIIVCSRGGKEYWLHRDQIPTILDGGLIYGIPLKKHHRATKDYIWMNPENVFLKGI